METANVFIRPQQQLNFCSDFIVLKVSPSPSTSSAKKMAIIQSTKAAKTDLWAAVSAERTM